MAAPILYRASDASAPILTGTAGDLVNLLDKCLVAGYGAKSAAGWTKPYTATNAAVFRMGAGNQFYLDVNDNGASTGLTGASGKEAAVRGYETMSAASTGTGPFPTTAQVAAATANWRKSASADTVPRGWFLIADDRGFILGILDGDAANCYKLYYFGDVYSIKSGDSYRAFITVRTVVNGTGTSGTLATNTNTSLSAGGIAGYFIPRIAAGTGTSVGAGLVMVGTLSTESSVPFPSLDNNIYLGRILLSDSSGTYLRGYLRGVYQILTHAGLNDGDTFSGTGDFTGKSFVVITGINGTAAGKLILETSAWDTSS